MRRRRELLTSAVGGWRAKAAIMAILSRMPGGRRLYRILQDLAGTSRLDLNAQYSSKRDRILRPLIDSGIRLEGAEVLEIGTGWHPVMPILLMLLGAGKVTTIDSNPWMTRRSLQETLAAFSDIAPQVASDLGIEYGEKLRLISTALRAGASVREALQLRGIHYETGVAGESTGFPDGSFDVVVTSDVLEHVPPDVLLRMQIEVRRLLRSGGVAIHYVNPGDHFATDHRITTINFLRYSSREWYWLGGSGLSYHNRLRVPDYLAMMNDAGFDVALVDTQVDERALEALRTGDLTPHSDFAHYSDSDLCLNNLTILARA